MKLYASRDDRAWVIQTAKMSHRSISMAAQTIHHSPSILTMVSSIASASCFRTVHFRTSSENLISGLGVEGLNLSPFWKSDHIDA